jgi:hypothetical protein
MDTDGRSRRRVRVGDHAGRVVADQVEKLAGPGRAR